MTIYIADTLWEADGISFLVDELPGFAAHYHGDDLAVAIKEAEAVLRDWIASNVDRGIDIPEPRSAKKVYDAAAHKAPRPRGLTQTSLRARFPAGRIMKVNLSIEERALAMIDEKARSRGITRSAFMVEASMTFD